MDTSITANDIGAERLSRIHRLADGRRIGYAEYGHPAGAPVLALHGTPGSRLMFSLSDELARERRLRMIAVDRPGYGLSDYCRYESLRQSADDIAALAEALGLRRFAIFGVSGGGPYAVAAAAAMPAKVLLLALVAPVGPIRDCRAEVSLRNTHKLIFQRLAPSPAATRAFFWSLKQVLRIAPGLAYRGLKLRVTPSDRRVLDDAEVRACLLAAIGGGLRHGVDGAVQDLRIFSEPWGLPLTSIDVPAVLWQGSDDTIVPAAASYWLAEKLPNCRLDVMHGAGHYWVFDQFGLVLDAVAAALHG
jgi:pimeloyl-ACP methyl ester carboxylesterase